VIFRSDADRKYYLRRLENTASDLHATYAVDWNPNKQALVLKQLLE